MDQIDINPQDRDHLSLLRIFHFVAGGMYLLFSLFPSMHLIMGLIIVIAPESMNDNHGSGPPVAMGVVFVAGALLIMGGFVAFAICNFLVGKYLRACRRHTFCLVIAALNCLNMPVGTALGIFSIVVLSRQSVKTLFTGRPPLGAPYRS